MFFLLFCAVHTVFAQTSVDSLIRLLPKIVRDSNEVNLRNQISQKLTETNSNQALIYAHQAKMLSKQIGFTRGSVQALNNLSWIYYRQSDYAQAFDYATQALKLGEQIHDYQEVGRALSNIAAIYNEQKEYRLSIDYFEKALQAFEKMNDKAGLTRSLNNLAFTAYKAELYQSALGYGEKALQNSKEIGNQYYEAFALRTIGDVYAKKNKYAEALSRWTVAAEISKKIYNNSLLAAIWVRMGKAYQEKKSYTEAIGFFKKAIDIGENYGYKSEKAQAYQQLSQVYQIVGDFKQGFDYQQKYLTLHDSIFNEQNSQKIALLQTQFESERKQAEIQLLKRDKKLQESEIDNQRLILLSLVGGFSTILIVSVLFWWRSRERGKANVLLNKQKAEIMEQAEKLNRLNELKNTILSIVSHDLRSPLAALKNTIDVLDFGDVSANEWENVKTEFSKQLGMLDFTLNNLLLWAKSQMQGESTQKKVIDLQAMADNKVILFQPLAKQKKIQLLNEIPASAHAYADANQIKIVFRNLIANAVKFTKEGGTITISSYSENGHITVAVKDTGKGLSKEQVEKLFDNQKPMITRGTAGEKGSGLGLILSKDFLQKNNGEIWAESEVGKGSTFYFTLPTK